MRKTVSIFINLENIEAKYKCCTSFYIPSEGNNKIVYLENAVLLQIHGV